MYFDYARRRTPRSAMGFSLDEVVNAPYLQAQLMRYTIKGGGPQSCWLWNGPKQVQQRNGHWYWQARMFIVLERGYTTASPARVAYLFDAGEIPDRRRIRHTCGEPLCVRPDHIVLANQNKTYWSRVKPLRKQQEREEIARHAAEQAVAGISGETVEQVRFYHWLGETPKDIAKHFGLKPKVVEHILAPEKHPGQHISAVS